MARRVTRFLLLLVASWTVMALTHELGHILGGTCSGGTLQSADLRPWCLPYSTFDPDPFPLVTLWSGLMIGILTPVAVAAIVQRDWMWFIANFCILANGTYVAAGWYAGDSYLDTTRLLEHGASPVTLAAYCCVTIGFGYVGFRRSCKAALTVASQSEPRTQQESDVPDNVPQESVGPEPE